MSEETVNAFVAALSAPESTPTSETPTTTASETTAVAASETDPSTTTTEADKDIPGTPEKTAPATEGTSDDEADPEALPADIAANPKVQALVAKAEEASQFRDLLAEGYAIATETQDGKPRPTAEVLADLRAERSDAHALYGIVAGKNDVGVLFDLLQDPAKYNSEVPERVFNNVIQYLASDKANNFLQKAIAAAGFKIVKADGSATTSTTPTSPEADRLSKLEGEIANQKNAEATRVANEEASKVVAKQQETFNTVVTKIEEMMTKKGVDASFKDDYVMAIAALVNGSPAIIQRVMKGNFADINKYFTQHHNKMLEQAKKYSANISTTKTSIEKQVPKGLKGNSTPTGSNAPTKRTVRTQDDRVKAITEMLSEE